MKALLFAVILIAICALLLWDITSAEKRARKKKATDNTYDERQMMARGKASHHAFIAVYVYLPLDNLASSSHPWAEPGVDALLGLALGFTVFAVACIRRNAFFCIGDNGISYLFSILALAILSGLITVRHWRQDALIVDGRVTDRAIWLMLMAAYLIIAAALAVRIYDNKREEREDDA